MAISPVFQSFEPDNFIFSGVGKTHKDAASVRATHAIPAACGIYYFEVRIVSKGRDGWVVSSFSIYVPMNSKERNVRITCDIAFELCFMGYGLAAPVECVTINIGEFTWLICCCFFLI